MLASLQSVRDHMPIPVIAAPMFLISGPDLVIACCKAGIMGSFPSANARTADELERWLQRITGEISAAREADPTASIAPFAVNIILQRSGSERQTRDLELLRRYRVPVVITSVGNPAEIAKVVHEYGGLVLHDVTTIPHAKKAISANVDGLIVLTAGAGGHTGMFNPFAILPQIRSMWNGAIILAGAISDGRSIRAAEVLGADFVYMGTRFAATQESLASPDYKALLVSQQTEDVIVTDRISGLNASFMRGSISARGLDPDNLPPRLGLFQPNLPHEVKAWRDIWSAGHGVGLIADIPSVAELVDRLCEVYRLSGR